MQQKTLQFGNNQASVPKNQMEIEDNKPKALLPWVEKYRPNNIKEISFQEDITKSLQGVLETGDLPHLLLHGPPGTGKTSSIIALAKDLYGPEFWKKRVMELNASDDRGIQAVREKVKKFAQTMVVKNPDPNYKCPKYKIIILDEADSMTTDAQSSLRRIIEDNSSNTRFCIICNYITKIIEPLASRCVKFRYKPISEEAQFNKLKSIVQAENINCDDAAIHGLINISGGDLRKSVNYLQSASQLYGEQISKQDIFDISGTVPDEVIQDTIDVMVQGDLVKILNKCKYIQQQGFSPEQLLNQLSEGIVQCNNRSQLTEIKKARILEKFAYSEKCLNEGADNELQLFNVLSSAYSIVTNPDFPTNQKK